MQNIDSHRFRIAIADEVLADLRERLARARLPAYAPKGANWAHGTSLPYMHETLAYWRDRYDWRKVEARLNRFAHYRLPVAGKRVHAIVEQGSGKNPLPLILTHGWPGSFVEFTEMIEPLAHPERFGGSADDGFTVIAASIPGYAFSDPPDVPLGPREVGHIWHQLMTETLGFARYGAHGSDWGAAITSWLAFDHPEKLAAIHLTMPILRDPASLEKQPPDAEEAAHLQMQGERMIGETGYQAIQGTKPQTLAYGLTDSPIGLAGWILEKYHTWSSARGSDRPPPMEPEHLITNIMMYWLNGPNASTWMYKWLVDWSGFILPPGRKITVPTGLCQFPDDVVAPAPPQWGRRSYNVARDVRAPKGSHFPGLDAAPFLIDDIRAFFKGFR